MTCTQRSLLILLLLPCFAFGSMTAHLSIEHDSFKQRVECKSYDAEGTFFFINPNSLYLQQSLFHNLALDFSFPYEGETITATNFQSKKFALDVVLDEFISMDADEEWPNVKDGKITFTIKAGDEIGSSKIVFALGDKAGKIVAKFEFLIEVQMPDPLAGGGVTHTKILMEFPIFLKSIDEKTGKINFKQLSIGDTLELEKGKEYRFFIELEDWIEQGDKVLLETIDFKNKGEASVEWGWKGKALNLNRMNDNGMFAVLITKETGRSGPSVLDEITLIEPDLSSLNNSWQNDLSKKLNGAKLNPNYYLLAQKKDAPKDIKFNPIILSPNSSKFQYFNPSKKENKIKKTAHYQFTNLHQLDYTKFIWTPQMNNFNFQFDANKATQNKDQKKWKNKKKAKKKKRTIEQMQFENNKVQGNNLNTKFKSPKKAKAKYYTLELLISKEDYPFDIPKTITLKIE